MLANTSKWLIKYVTTYSDGRSRTMLYVERDTEGKIIALHNKPAKGISERKSLMDEEVHAFLSQNIDTDSSVQMLALSDMGIIRILEDLIDLLIRKNIILFTELPPEAQEKITVRKQVREKIVPSHLIEDDIL